MAQPVYDETIISQFLAVSTPNVSEATVEGNELFAGGGLFFRRLDDKCSDGHDSLTASRAQTAAPFPRCRGDIRVAIP
jgi:hypothetical protein